MRQLEILTQGKCRNENEEDDTQLKDRNRNVYLPAF